MTGLILGAVIAGGRSSRFGSDKALAEIDGRPMLEHVIASLRPQVDDLVISGRPWPGVETIEDRQPGQLGPLAGLETALYHAAAQGFDAIISVPIDTLPLPSNLRMLFAGDLAATLRHQHLVGYWPARHRLALSRYIDAGFYSLRGWIEECEAAAIEEPIAIYNINHVSDLSGFEL